MNRSLLTRLFCLLLVVIMLPIPVEAAENDVTYSDLFYGYDTEYLITGSLHAYARDTGDAMAAAADGYMQSSDRFLTALSGGLSAATHPMELITVLLDSGAEAGFSYRAALDSANQKLAAHLLSSHGSQFYETHEANTRIAELADSLYTVYNSFENNWNAESGTEKTMTQVFFERLAQSNLFPAFSSAILKDIGTAASEAFPILAKGGKDALEILYTIGMGLMVEQLRMEVLNDVLRHTPENSVLADGFTRLRSQLTFGFVTYFADNYLVPRMMEQLTDLLVSWMASSIGPLDLAKSLVDVSRTVIFDMILQTPNMDEVFSQMVLSHYASDLYQVVRTKANVFLKPFSVSDIREYESLVCTLIAATEAGLKASESLSSADALQAAVARYSGYTYTQYKTDVRTRIRKLPPEERNVKTYAEPWVITGATVLRAPSNTISSNSLYLFDGGIWADVEIRDNFVLSPDDGSPFTIHGDLQITNSTPEAAVVPEGQRCTVDGLLWIRVGGTLYNEGALSCTELQLSQVYNHNSILQNDGTLTVSGNITAGSSWTEALGRKSGLLIQKNPDAVLYLGGHFLAHDPDCSRITGGTVLLLDGSSHTLTNLVCHDLTAEPSAGITLGSDLVLTGHLTPGVSPPICGKYALELRDGGSLAPGAGFYGNVRVTGDVTLGSVTMDTLTVTGNLTVPRQAALTVRDAVFVSGSMRNNGTLQCANLQLQTGSSLNNTGTLTVIDDLHAAASLNFVLGDTYSSLIQSDPDASIHIGRTFTADHLNCLRITGGKLTNPPIQETEALIDAIGPVTADSEAAILRAETAYDALSQAQQSFVSNAQQLWDAKALWNTLRDLLNRLQLSVRMSEDGTSFAASLSNDTDEPAPDLTLLLAVYDSRGKFLRCQAHTVAPTARSQESRSISLSPGQQASAFLLTPAGLLPILPTPQ